MGSGERTHARNDTRLPSLLGVGAKINPANYFSRKNLRIKASFGARNATNIKTFFVLVPKVARTIVSALKRGQKNGSAFVSFPIPNHAYIFVKALA